MFCPAVATMAAQTPSTTVDIKDSRETMPCQKSPVSKVLGVVRVLGFGMLMIACSVLLIDFNKYLISSKTFPFPLHLVLMHTFTGSIFAAVLYQVVPSLFPTLTDPLTSMRVNRELIMGKALPVAFAFAGSLVLSNMAYEYASVSFLQFMKEANVILVYCLSLMIGLEFFRWRALAVLAFIMGATMACVRGELHFSMVGFVMQGTSQVFEVVKIVLQSMLLTSVGLKLDALTCVLVILPLCFAVLLVTLFLISGLQMLGVQHVDLIRSPQWADIVVAAPLLFLNALAAFSLNVSIALFLKNTSAVAMVLAMIIKDCTVVLFSMVLFREAISRNQVIGFSIQLLGVLTWSLMKQFPDQFEQHGVLDGLLAVLAGGSTQRKETKSSDQCFSDIEATDPVSARVEAADPVVHEERTGMKLNSLALVAVRKPAQVSIKLTTIGGRKLGLSLKLQENHCQVGAIMHDGFVANWNFEHPNQAMLVGSTIWVVNNVRGSGAKIRDALKQGEEFQVTFSNPLESKDLESSGRIVDGN